MTRILDATGYDTDKAKAPQYVETYQRWLGPLADREVKLLEIGVYRGGSLRLWRDYFPKGTIVGLDYKDVDLGDDIERITIYKGRQQDRQLLDRIRAETAPDGFDIIIDDGSHLGELTRISFWHLFENHLKEGGIYSIEDWGVGYWADRKDGGRARGKPGIVVPTFQSKVRGAMERLAGLLPSDRLSRMARRAMPYKRRFLTHDYGMVGVVKELVDECGLSDITDPEYGTPPRCAPRIRRLEVSPGLVVAEKVGETR